VSLVSLLTLRTSCKEQSDNVGASFISDAEWNGYIRSAYADLYGKIVQAFGNDYFVQSPSAGYTFTTDGTNQLFALPMTGGVQLVFKLLGVDVLVQGSTQYVSLKSFAFADRNQFGPSQIPQAGQTVRILYVPQPTLPTQDTDTIDGVNGWEDSIVIDACIKALGKEDSDVSVFLTRRAAMDKRLESEIENRNASESGGAIVDVTRRQPGGMRYRLNGNNLWLIGPNAGMGYGYDWSAEF
jgi:hypothetical protein